MELGKRNVARSAPDLLETIMKAVGDFSGNNFHDDLTLVVVAVK
jgi:serine phosphatase RsbU (regulator of sigma subunit)